MDMLEISGGKGLNGCVCVEGAKNAALPIMAASIACHDTVQLSNVPNLVDVDTMSALLRTLGLRVTSSGPSALTIDTTAARGNVADYDLVRRMRASICVLGPLLARHRSARVSLPGGCNIGHRPIDLHLKGLSALGADLRVEGGYVVAEANELLGTEVDLSGPRGATVTGTCNVMVAASLARGTTVIRGAAREPEVCDLAEFLNRSGANIQGYGTSVMEIRGVEQLNGVCHRIIPDRIEAATLAIAAAATRGQVELQNVACEQMKAVLEALQEIGVTVEQRNTTLFVSVENELRPASITAMPYPGIPTDTQAQFMALLTSVAGASVVTDVVFPDRFMHVAELHRMGADIQMKNGAAVVSGGNRLSGAQVMASDLRASAALVIAALTAQGNSQIRRIYHLDRGYSALEKKLCRLGANVTRVTDQSHSASVKPPHMAQRKFSVNRSLDRQDN